MVANSDTFPIEDAGKAAVCSGCPGRELCLSQGQQKDPDQDVLDLRLRAIRHKILVLSGKGGVGKSSIASQFSIQLAQSGKKVGLLDVDICGPSAPKLLGVTDQIIETSQWGWKPAISPQGGVKVLSVGSLLSSDSHAVVWRGPRKTSMIKKMIKDTFWGRLDYLIIDTPPGTSDEHLTIVQLLARTKPDGAIIVTSPQRLSAGVVSREIRFCQKLNVPILGILENMSGFQCPCCHEVTDLFSRGGGEELAMKYNIPFLGKIPLDSDFTVACESGLYTSQGPASTALETIITSVTNIIS
ncbi:cytosolic Fe-S cluster assembly factor NUBP2 homolog isoform X1 [Oratosquilla oratoria]|uniref:cytosolic Fe-S cluster assembly factor NUBP2 homolog isoform X1 n=1 Tax=Oratosquilla oratoria TaxID=337810 RepID=UPI003F75929B